MGIFCNFLWVCNFPQKTFHKDVGFDGYDIIAYEQPKLQAISIAENKAKKTQRTEESFTGFSIDKARGL